MNDKNKERIENPASSIPLHIPKFDYSINADQFYEVFKSLLKVNGFTSHHNNSANDFYTSALTYVITKGFEISKTITNLRNQTEIDKSISHITVKVDITNPRLAKPTYTDYKTNKQLPLYPSEALARDLPYSSSLFVDIHAKATAYLHSGGTLEVKEAVIEKHDLCRVPVIVNSIACNKDGLSKEQLIELGEDPTDTGGYFIVNGGEWATECTESMTYNQPKIYKNEGYGKSRIRCEFISKPGDEFQNSEYFIIRYFKDNSLTIEIHRDRLDKVQIPFFLFFRAFGWTDDKEIIDHIVQDYDNPIDKDIFECISGAMRAPYTYNDQSLNVLYKEVYNKNYTKKNELKEMGFRYRDKYSEIDCIKCIIDMIPEDRMKYFDLKNKPENYQQAIEEIYRHFDINFLPHIGVSSDHRRDKLKFTCFLIRKLFLVYNDVIPQTDRDNYRVKRLHAIGPNYCKVFKTYYNQTRVMPLKKKLTKTFTESAFLSVNLKGVISQSLQNDDFQNVISKTITTGHKSQLSTSSTTLQKTTNRLQAQQLNRKNQTTYIANLRSVIAPSHESAKQSDRAKAMRYVPRSATHGICCIHSPTEGNKVGINKQISIFAIIAPYSSGEVLKKRLLEDSMIVNNINPIEISRGDYTSVFVNGYPVGYTNEAMELLDKYKNLRRKLIIHPYTTIFWDNIQREICFSVDMGRLCFPMVIVYNTERDSDKFIKSNNGGHSGRWMQGTAINAEDIRLLELGEKDIYDLVREQKVEFIAPEEQENCWVCPSYTQLCKDKYNEYREYTHCIIEQALVGITAASAPGGSHSAAVRTNYQGAMLKQSGGIYALNWVLRFSKEAFLQYKVEMPMVCTMINDFLFPNGMNVMVAVITGGMNLEDGLIMCKSSIDRGGYNGGKLTYEKIEVRKEKICIPSFEDTEGLKKTSTYGKLGPDGIIRVGTYINKGDVLIGRVIQNPKKESRYKWIDKSVVYNGDEDAIIYNIVNGRNGDDVPIIKIGIMMPRKPIIGDKFASREGQKGVLSSIWGESDMPYDAATGKHPTFLFNPHGIPTRMTISQEYEQSIASIATIKGGHIDNTIFRTDSVQSIIEGLTKAGLENHGYRRMINGFTGEYIDTMIFYGPVFYQRLMKFALDTGYSVKHALTDAITHQPLEGQRSDGGLRLGEMEKDAMVAQGSVASLHEKYTTHSDGWIEYFCRNCSNPAIVNHRENIYICQQCGDLADIVSVPTTCTASLFRKEQMSCNIDLKTIIDPYVYEIYDDVDETHTSGDVYTKKNIKATITKYKEFINVDSTKEY